MIDELQRPDTAVSRRRALAAGAGMLAAGVAGCLGDGGASGATEPGTDGNAGGTDENTSAADEDGPVVVASFFSFYDFARKIADGTPLRVKNLVPTGLHGHGWEPDASVTRDIIDADAFVHVGEDFQPWADRAIETIRNDGVDTHLVNVREGVELVSLAASLDPDEEGVGEGRGKDPHFWLDPQRAKQSVDNITEGLVEVAPEYEDALRENASTYKTDVLDRIDRDYEALFDRAERDVVQLAAHNAFQYIGAGVFETRRPAKQLVRETPVEAYFPVTPYAGVREEWVANGWGYEDIAYNVNMPTFGVVVGAHRPEAAGPEGWHEQWRNFE